MGFQTHIERWPKRMTRPLTVFLVLCVYAVTGFNVDVSTPQIFTGPSKSHFGLSVGLLSNDDGKWVLVGAPKLNSSFQVNVKNPGGVFKCRIGGRQECLPIKVDDTGNTTFKLNPLDSESYHDFKRNQWLGVALDVQPFAMGNVTVCAHRWMDQKYSGHVLANGMCFEIDHTLRFSSVRTLRPLTQVGKQIIAGGIYLYAHGEVGMAVHYTKDTQSQLLLGAPGVMDWTGTTVEYGSTLDSLRVQRSPPEIPRASLAGYSLSSGKFFHHGRVSRVVGAPRTKDHGKVFIYEENFRDIITDKEGTQMGSYFGAAVCAVDVNYDDLDDLLVGAPLYRDLHGDEGRVYLYINEGMGILRLQENLLSGSNIPFSRFGTAIADIGDLNQDDYKDVVIGAPYEMDGVGSVYIYHGHSTGLRVEPAQRIEGLAVDTGLRGFGYAISRGEDLDDNGYPDFAVGAYNSDQAIVFYTRPKINIGANFEITPREIDTNSHAYDCKVGSVYHFCQEVTLCMMFYGHRAPNKQVLNYTIYADTLKARMDGDRARRVLFVSPDKTKGIRGPVTGVMNLTHSHMPKCHTHFLIVEIPTRDVLTSIVYEVDISLVPSDPTRPDCRQCPVLSPHTQSHLQTEAVYTKECGADRICQCDVSVRAAILRKDLREVILIGADKHITLRMEIENTGDASYGTTLTVLFSREIHFVHMQKLSGHGGAICDRFVEVNETRETVHCEIGNPLPGDSQIILAMTFDTSHLKLHHFESEIELSMRVTTLSEETPLQKSNNEISKRIPISLHANYAVNTKSTPDHVTYSSILSALPSNSTVRTDETFDHLVDILNTGPSVIPPIFLDVYFPTHTLDGVELAVLDRLEISNDVQGMDSGWSCTKFSRKNTTIRITGNTTIDSSGPIDSRQRPRNIDTLDCSSTLCSVAQCTLDQMGNGESAFMVTSVRIDIKALRNLKGKDEISYTSTTVVRIDSAYALEGLSQLPQPFVVSVTTPLYKKELDSPGVPWWIVAVSIGVGVGMLGVMIVVFWKLGFFRRTAREDLQRLIQEDSDNLIQQDDYEVPSPSYLNTPTSPTPLLDPSYADAFSY